MSGNAHPRSARQRVPHVHGVAARLARWPGVTVVVEEEATGVYWRPVWHVLKGSGVPRVRAAHQAASHKAERSAALPLQGLPERRLPADSWLPGQSPAHDAKWAVVGNRSYPGEVIDVVEMHAQHERVVLPEICLPEPGPARDLRSHPRASHLRHGIDVAHTDSILCTASCVHR